MYAGRDQNVDVGGAFINAGSVAALGNVAITAGSVDSEPGALLGAVSIARAAWRSPVR
jgi:hypothetical protein